MPKTQVKPKAKSKKRLKTKTTSKAKNKTKTKIIKFKAKPKAKLKAKSKSSSSTKVKAKVKTKAKMKPKTSLKTKTKIKPKTRLKAKVSATIQFTKIQKTNLIELIKKIVDLRKKTVDGLKSLDAIDHILDQYNQKFTDAPEKFDAIVNYAVIEHANYISNSGFIALKDTGKDSIALYALLSEIGKGKVQFSKASDEMNSIFQQAIKK